MDVFINETTFSRLLETKPRRMRPIEHPMLNSDVDPKQRYLAFLNISFKETVEIIFDRIVPGIRFYPDKYGSYGHGIEDKEELNNIKAFLKYHNRRVFLRSLLKCMVAVDMTFESEQNEAPRTPIGNLVHHAKIQHETEAVDKLILGMSQLILKTPVYNKADAILAVPPSCDSDFSLPRGVASGIATSLNIFDYSSDISFTAKNKRLQNETAADKWKVLQQSGLVIEKKGICNRPPENLILLDDLYQSGATIHFVAAALQTLGVKNILGLAMVKSRRDSDNS